MVSTTSNSMMRTAATLILMAWFRTFCCACRKCRRSAVICIIDPAMAGFLLRLISAHTASFLSPRLVKRNRNTCAGILISQCFRADSMGYTPKNPRTELVIVPQGESKALQAM